MTQRYLKLDPEDEARLVRIETMLFKLCQHMGMDPRTGQIQPNPPMAPVIYDKD